MKPLTYDEIVKVNSVEQLTWHPDYDHQPWKDGEPPLTLIHCSYLGIFRCVDGKDRKHYFVGYRCSKENCPRCEATGPSTEIGPHHIIIARSGLSISKRIEFVETKKKTIIKEHNNPVFIKYERQCGE